MARKRKEDAEKTRTRILASALSLFARKGYEHTTFNDIAERLSMTKGAVYWHFDSKEALLVALVDMALEKFRHELEMQKPKGELTFPSVAEMMVRNAEQIVSNPRAAAFFRLMKCQVKWTDASMARVREDLMSNDRLGPKQAFKDALANDMAAGRAHAGTDTEEVAMVCLSLWDGLVQARLDHFLACDLQLTLKHAFASIWDSVRIR